MNRLQTTANLLTFAFLATVSVLPAGSAADYRGITETVQCIQDGLPELITVSSSSASRLQYGCAADAVETVNEAVDGLTAPGDDEGGSENEPAADNEAMDTAFVCVGGACPSVGDGCAAGLTLAQADAADIDCGSGSKKCRWYQTWEVEGENDPAVTVEFKAECGSSVVSICDTVQLPQCEGLPGDGGDELGCWHDILSGDPALEVIGKCVDPANPKIVYRSIPRGLEYIAAEHVVFLE